MTIDPWFNTQLFEGLYIYLIDYERLIGNTLFLLHNNISSSSYLNGAVECFPLQGFKPFKNISVLIYDLFVRATAQGVQSFGSILCYSYMYLPFTP